MSRRNLKKKINETTQQFRKLNRYYSDRVLAELNKVDSKNSERIFITTTFKSCEYKFKKWLNSNNKNLENTDEIKEYILKSKLKIDEKFITLCDYNLKKSKRNINRKAIKKQSNIKPVDIVEQKRVIEEPETVLIKKSDIEPEKEIIIEPEKTQVEAVTESEPKKEIAKNSKKKTISKNKPIRKKYITKPYLSKTSSKKFNYIEEFLYIKSRIKDARNVLNDVRFSNIVEKETLSTYLKFEIYVNNIKQTSKKFYDTAIKFEKDNQSDLAKENFKKSMYNLKKCHYILDNIMQKKFKNIDDFI